MKETDRRDPASQRTGNRETELVYRYEEGYDAEIHPDLESLSEQFAEYAEGPLTAYNVPVWLEYDDETDVPTVSIAAQ